MSSPAADYKKRPPPIAIPEWPSSWNAPARDASVRAPSHTRGSEQRPQRFASSSTQPAVRSGTTTPLTSPLESDDVRITVPQSGSHSSKHRTSAMTSLSGLMDQARGSPRKSDCVSLPSRQGSTARSRQSERSHRSALIAQAQLEALDEDEGTKRSQIESRTERRLFKMTGQVPPTPATGPIDPERVFIRTEDLRDQCRTANGGEQARSEELARSPKKKLFGVSLPMFGRPIGTTPAMPPKAAQILGTTPSRKPQRIEPRSIRSTRVLKTPTKASRSDTARSFTAKIYGEVAPVKSHHSTSTRRRHMAGRRSPGKENTPPRKQMVSLPSFESMSPPTPPAKDTPPDLRLPKHPPSPLRRAPSHEDLRESYSDHPDRGVQVQLPFPIFALSPSPPKTAVHGTGGMSPSKFRPYTAEDYTKLIEGEAMHWPYPEEDTECEVKEGGYSASLASEQRRELLQLPQSCRSEDQHYNERLGRRLSPLPPRFYSPSDRSVRLFKDDESPSHNTDTSRMLFTPPLPDLPNQHSHNRSTEMAYHGSSNVSDPGSPGMQVAANDDARNQPKQVSQQRDDADLAASVEQALRIDEQRKLPTPTKSGPSRVDTDVSSSKPNDMLNSATPRIESQGNFRVVCPSAVPSPLHRQHGPYVPVPLAPILRGAHAPAPALTGPWPSPRTNKTIEDHFFMTNEHLDVVGKTIYDALDMYAKQQINATNASHEQLAVALEGHIKDLKAHIGSVDEKAEKTFSQTHNVNVKLDQLEKFVKDEVLVAMAGQAKKTAEIQSSLKAVQSTMTHMQQAMEKLCAAEPGPQALASSTLPGSGGSTYMSQNTPNHQSQPALTSYYGNETRRDEHSPMPPVHDRALAHNYDSNGDPRANFNWQSQAWNGRQSYHGRNKGEANSYGGANPYHSGNSMQGQYNGGYMSGYPSYNFSPTGSEQPYVYGQKPAQG